MEPVAAAKHAKAPRRLPHVGDLRDPRALAALFRPIAEVSATPLATPGFSGSTHERLTLRFDDGRTRRLLLKHTRVAADWILVQSHDRDGREGLLLGEPALAGVWGCFACPYLAWAAEDGEVALLMDDLTHHLFPDVREPIAQDHEERILTALAAMHARYWQSPALALPWLAAPASLFNFIGPRAVEEQTAPGTTPPPVIARAREGWAAAFTRLPASVSSLLREPPESLANRLGDLPRTLIHGDVKVANFALLPDGRIAAFDWACLAAAPVVMELGWHLAVNASRLPGSKEQSLARYRRLLESALGRELGEEFWRRTEAGVALAGGAMLLWSKALALGNGSPGAAAEWDWWVRRLEAV